ncbi:MAG: Rrf2 family transcriptional regulator [Lachnospiraceae bacterium]|nr:Rrf2 family transcriptional regulator [Lachnospiraceae bacterium]
MKVSTRVEYGLIALTDIVLHSADGQSVSAPEISQRQNISRKYLEQILMLLRQGGFITAQKGLRGGYTLSKPPGEIRLSEVLNALDSNILADMDEGDEEGELRSVINECFWGRINDSLKRYTNDLRLSDFADSCRNRFSGSWDMYTI